MLVMLEKEIRKEIKDKWDKTVRITRIESPGTRRSIPDVQLRSHTADWWVEIKRYENKGIASIVIPWRPGQLAWLESHADFGGNVALIFCMGRYYFIIQDIKNICASYNGLDHLKNCSDYNGNIWAFPDDVWETG